ncbi:MAG: hypothetical protein HY681_13800 [Chloroflexi bacterium]|nr:hypothetical protein [Chloroflexota bacterium]
MRTLVWPREVRRQRAQSAGAAIPQALVVGWLRLAVASLAVAGLFAVLVAAARTPVVQTLVGENYFRISLVGHVTFSLNVWLLSFAGALWALALARLGIRCNEKAGGASLWLATVGAAIMAVASLAGRGVPSLVDYIPVLEAPAFAAGLIAFLGGIGLGAVTFLVALRRAPQPLPTYAQALRIGAVVYLLAIATLVTAVNTGWQGDWATVAWGPGHLLQLVNGASMIAAWLLLQGAPSVRFQAPLRAALPFLLTPALVVPVIYLLPGPIPKGVIGSVTWAALAAPTVVAWLMVACGVLRERRWSALLSPLVISLALFFAGALAAALGLEGDTRVTAHYHAIVGAVTVALMGLTFHLIPPLGMRVRLPKLACLQPAIYGSGLMLLIAGLFWASSYGGQRKAFEAFALHSGVLGPMGLFGAGAALAVGGGAAFVLVAGTSLLARTRSIPVATAEPRPTVQRATAGGELVTGDRNGRG